MAKKDKRVDAYIAKAQPFAQPILKHLRKLVHQANPEVVETIKWGMPSFEHKGPCCGMAAFKEHLTFGFWKYKLLKDPKNYLGARSNEGGEAMWNLGRISKLKDLPPDKAIIDFVKQATKLNDDGIKQSKTPKPKKALVVPEYFTKAIHRDKKAKDVWTKFTESMKREYTEWIVDAKTEETREKRMLTAIEWIAEGKKRNWKYEPKKRQ